MKGFASVVAVLLAAINAAVSSSPRVPDSIGLSADEEAFLQATMDKCSAIGRPDLARRLESDLAAGRVTIADAPVGVLGTTDWHFLGPNTMEISRSNFDNWRVNEKAAGKARDRGLTDRVALFEGQNRTTLLDLALTVAHEYVHMSQRHPTESRESEDPAWRHRLDEERRLINEASGRIERALANGNSSELNSAVQDLKDIQQVHGGTVGELKKKIEDGDLTPETFAADQQSHPADEEQIGQLLSQAANAPQPGPAGATTATNAAPNSANAAEPESPFGPRPDNWPTDEPWPPTAERLLALLKKPVGPDTAASDEQREPERPTPTPTPTPTPVAGSSQTDFESGEDDAESDDDDGGGGGEFTDGRRFARAQDRLDGEKEGEEVDADYAEADRIEQELRDAEADLRREATRMQEMMKQKKGSHELAQQQLRTYEATKRYLEKKNQKKQVAKKKKKAPRQPARTVRKRPPKRPPKRTVRRPPQQQPYHPPVRQAPAHQSGGLIQDY